MGLNTRMNITGERGSPWKVPVLNGNFAVVHDGPVITPVSREYSYVTLEFPEVTLVMLSFHFLIMRKPTSACRLLASYWYSRWRVV